MFGFLAFIFFISFISLIVFAILTIKNRKNDKKKKYVKNCKILIGIIITSFIGCGITAPPENLKKNDTKPTKVVEVKAKKEEPKKVNTKKVNTKKDEPKKKEEPKKEPEKVKPKTTNTFDEAKVVRVVDGDTIHVFFNGQKYKIRMIGVDTPETVHPRKPVEFYGKEASDFTKKSLSDRTVYLQKDVSETDRYGRLLRYVWLARPSSNNPTEQEIRDKMYNAKLILDGYGSAVTFQPDSKYSHLFNTFQREARDNNKGLWNKEYESEFSSENNNSSSDNRTEETNNNFNNYNPDTSSGKIKGNIKSKKYHVPGGRYYNKISEDNVIYFDTEQDAIDAGYVRAKR